MLIKDRFSGNNNLFIGNRVSVLRRIPVGARITSARAVIMPLQDENGTAGVSRDRILFRDENDNPLFAGPNGEVKTVRSSQNGFEEIDFHRRVTLYSMDMSNVDTNPGPADRPPGLQVDAGGGTFMEINSRGAFKSPDDADYPLTNDTVELPGLAVNKIRVTQASTPIASIVSITVLNIARNVSLAIGEQPAFFLHPGDLVRPQTSIDFAEMLQATLDTAEQENGYYVLPLNLKSENLSRVAIDLSIDYVMQKQVLPPGLSSVKMPYEYNAVSEGGNRLSLSIPEGMRVLGSQTTARIEGRFGNSKIVQGSFDEPDASAPVIKVNAGLTQAQAFSVSASAPGEDIAVDAIDLLLTSITPVAKVQIDVREDLDGRPAGQTLLASKPQLQITTDTSASPTWGSLAIGQPIKLRKSASASDKPRRYWLLVQSLEGEAGWTVADGSVDSQVLLMQSKDGGLSWRENVVPALDAPPKAEFRLRQNTDTFKVPVELKVGTGVEAKRLGLSRFEPLGQINFSLDGAELSNTINAYLDASEKQRLPEGEQLINPEFDLELDTPTFTLLGWEQTGAYLEPVGTPLHAVLVGNYEGSEDSGISQPVPAVPSCEYELTFIGQVFGEDCRIELVWRGGDCVPVTTDVLELPDLGDNYTSGMSFSSLSSFSMLHSVSRLTPMFRLRATAPEGVNQVEVRLVVPAGSVVTSDRVSLVATPQKVINDSFMEIGSEAIAGWTVNPPDAFATGALDVTPRAGALEFENKGTAIQPVSLSQQIAVTPGQAYLFEHSGLGGSSGEGEARPEIQLRFLPGEGQAPVMTAIAVLSVEDGESHNLSGVVPEGATLVELAIVMPQATFIQARRFSLQATGTREVAIDFLSEAPGDLTVSDVRVGFEPVAAPPAPVPEAGFCDATPANQLPGDDCCRKTCACFCKACKSEVDMVEAVAVAIENGRTAFMGTCIGCGGSLYSNSSTAIAEITSVPIRRVERRLIVESAPIDTIPLTEVAYIGEVRAATLEANNIGNLSALAEASPRTLAAMLEVNAELAESFVVQARKLLIEDQLKMAGISEGTAERIATRFAATSVPAEERLAGISTRPVRSMLSGRG